MCSFNIEIYSDPVSIKISSDKIDSNDLYNTISNLGDFNNYIKSDNLFRIRRQSKRNGLEGETLCAKQ